MIIGDIIDISKFQNIQKGKEYKKAAKEYSSAKQAASEHIDGMKSFKYPKRITEKTQKAVKVGEEWLPKSIIKINGKFVTHVADWKAKQLYGVDFLDN